MNLKLTVTDKIKKVLAEELALVRSKNSEGSKLFISIMESLELGSTEIGSLHDEICEMADLIVEADNASEEGKELPAKENSDDKKLSLNKKREILRANLGEWVGGFHGGCNMIWNTSSEIQITEETIEKIAKRKQCYWLNGESRIWYEGKQK